MSFSHIGAISDISVVRRGRGGGASPAVMDMNEGKKKKKINSIKSRLAAAMMVKSMSSRSLKRHNTFKRK